MSSSQCEQLMAQPVSVFTIQAPESMKAVVQAAWLLTTAFGDLIVIFVASVHLLPQVLFGLTVVWISAKCVLYLMSSVLCIALLQNN